MVEGKKRPNLGRLHIVKIGRDKEPPRLTVLTSEPRGLLLPPAVTLRENKQRKMLTDSVAGRVYPGVVIARILWWEVVVSS